MRVFSHLCFVFVCCMLPAGTYFVSEASFNIILCRMSNAISMVHFIAVVYIVFLCYNSTDNPQPFHLCILLWLLWYLMKFVFRYRCDISVEFFMYRDIPFTSFNSLVFRVCLLHVICSYIYCYLKASVHNTLLTVQCNFTSVFYYGCVFLLMSFFTQQCRII